MWTPGYNEGYAPLLPPPPPPTLPNFRLQQSPSFHTPTPTHQYQHNGGQEQSSQFHASATPHQYGGRGRGRGNARPQQPPMQNQGGRMPAGLAGPWQQTHQHSANMLQSNKPVTQVATPPLLAAQERPSLPPINYQPSKTKVDVSSVKAKLLEGLMNIKAESYPKELLDKFSPLKCDLCVAKMNSTVQAKMHYNGKQHEKKVRMFLANWTQTTGEPMPKRAKLDEQPTQMVQELKAVEPAKTEKTSVSMYCKCCDLSFTSTLHAEQHYMGRNHQRIVLGLAPQKCNYFNPATGKWQKKSIIGSKGVEDPTGRFGIGTEFSSQVEPEMSIEEKKGKFHCAVCDIAATSQDQLDMHYRGSKHRRMSAAAEMAAAGNVQAPQQQIQKQQPKPPKPQKQQPIIAPPGKHEESLLMSVTKDMGSGKGPNQNKDLSFFRTPSGKYYCQPCNLTLNSESQFTSHTESKKHKLRQASQKPAMPLTGPKAAQWGDKSSSSATTPTSSPTSSASALWAA